MLVSTLKGIIFDLDGTLYSLKRPKLWMALALWKDLGVLRHLEPVRMVLRDRSFADRDELNGALFSELARRAQLTPDQAAKWYEDRFLANFVRLLSRHARVRPGLVPLLERLRALGIHLAVVSDYGQVARRLQALQIPPELFDDVVAAEDLGVLKPSEKPFLALSRKWGVEPGTVLVVGDRVDLDAMSARSAEMEFLGISDRPASRSRAPGFVGWPEAAEMLESRADPATCGIQMPEESTMSKQAKSTLG